MDKKKAKNITKYIYTFQTFAGTEKMDTIVLLRTVVSKHEDNGDKHAGLSESVPKVRLTV